MQLKVKILGVSLWVGARCLATLRNRATGFHRALGQELRVVGVRVVGILNFPGPFSGGHRPKSTTF